MIDNNICGEVNATGKLVRKNQVRPRALDLTRHAKSNLAD